MASSRLRESTGVLAAQLAGTAAFFGLWEMAVTGGWAGEAKFGQPSRIAAHFWVGLADGTLLRHLGVTLYEELAGFALGTLLGTAIGLGLWWSPLLSRVPEPFAVIFNSLPKIALAPPFIVWFGIPSKRPGAISRTFRPARTRLAHTWRRFGPRGAEVGASGPCRGPPLPPPHRAIYPAHRRRRTARPPGTA